MRCAALILTLAIAGVLGGTWAASGWRVSSASGLHADDHDGRPVAVLEATHHDLGTVAAGAPLVARFTVRNRGDRRLVIRRENAACCGMSSSDDFIIVPPDGSAELVTTIELGDEAGSIRKTIRFATNDPARPQLELMVFAERASSSR